jgi:hypothetical protein
MIQQEVKAASVASYSRLFIGQDRAGHWVVKDAQSLCGGLFANRTEAIRFAMYECQRRPQSVIMLPDGLELDGPLDQREGSDQAKRAQTKKGAPKSRPPACSIDRPTCWASWRWRRWGRSAWRGP